MQVLYDKIFKAQDGNKEVLLELIQKFEPLLKKYSKILNYEDSFNDLQTQLIQIIKGMDLTNLRNTEDTYLLSYLSKCIKNYSIYLSRKQNLIRQAIPLSAFVQEDNDHVYTYSLDKLMSTTDEYLQVEFDLLFRLLTIREAEIIIYFYYYGYPVKKIATLYRVSVPAISQSKTNAIKKLKKYMSA